MMEYCHATVLPEETLAYLAPKPDGTYLDCTGGGGGHARAIAERLGSGGRLVVLDRDPVAVEVLRNRLASFGEKVTVLQRPFGELAGIGLAAVNGILFDLGVSSPQLDWGERGFSYRQDGPLDMRMNPQGGESAADLVNDLPEKELARIIRRYGEEPFAGKIARAIVLTRSKGPFNSTVQLAQTVREAIPAFARRTGPHPAKQTFQALRIAVNDELGQLSQGLGGAMEVSTPGGRIAVISFHSLEDRMVKDFFRAQANPCRCPPRFPCVCGLLPRVRILTPRPITPGEREVVANFRARGAKLRAAEVLPQS